MKTELKMPKTRKSFLKRFKISRNRKILRRISGINHFLSKKPSNTKRKKKKLCLISDDVLEYKNI
jgi:ribosomal protein L35